jgi:hypothetical protein
MFRMTTLKISLLSALATLMLLIVMLVTSGTASAHTASCQPQVNPACIPQYHPQLTVYNVKSIWGSCKEVSVNGAGFAPGKVALVATRAGFGGFGGHLRVFPHTVYATTQLDVAGSFSRDVTICGIGFGSWGFTAAFLVGIDQNGVHSNKVLVQ